MYTISYYDVWQPKENSLYSSIIPQSHNKLTHTGCTDNEIIMKISLTTSWTYLPLVYENLPLEAAGFGCNFAGNCPMRSA